MATLNEFKIINQRSLRMSEYIPIKNVAKLSELEKMRLGFYHLVLENITGLKDVSEIKSLIIDTEYNKVVDGVGIDDLGMDAVYISDEGSSTEHEIKFFNFKFREKFNIDKTKEEEPLSRSTKFLEYIINEDDINDVNELVREKILDIREKLNSNSIYNISLYMVSNEANGFDISSDKYIEILEKSYGMKIISVSLDDIAGFIYDNNVAKKCKFMISQNDFLTFDNNDKSTQRSYIIKMNLIDLIRITSKDKELAENYNFEEDSLIQNAKLDLVVLYDNVRGYLGETNFNKNIEQSLMNQHKEFFMFNNGLTFTASNIGCIEKNSGKKFLFTIEDFQIVNGGQTIRSIYNFLNSQRELDKVTKLREAYVLVRIFKIAEDNVLKNDIAEYTNSQNAISPIDLKSVDNIQVQIEKYLKELSILYARKSGELGDIDFSYEHRISMERLAQVIYSAMGFPDRVSNQKKKLFLDYYDDIFKGKIFTLEYSYKLILLFFEIQKCYDATDNIEYIEQKAFYIIYMHENFDCNINTAIDILEVTLKNFSSQVSNARKLIQKGFKTYLDQQLEVKNSISMSVI